MKKSRRRWVTRNTASGISCWKPKTRQRQLLRGSKKGEKFEKLAAKSKDPGSKGNGGDLGWQLPPNLVPEFSAVMVKLNKGQITTEPVKSQFGWHVIKLEDTRATKIPSFEEVKPDLRKRHQQEQIGKALEELRAAAKIEFPAAADKK